MPPKISAGPPADPMKELRARAMLVHLRSPLDHVGRLRLNQQTFEALGRHGLNRAWVSQAANALVQDELAKGSVEDGAVTLRITEAGWEASW